MWKPQIDRHVVIQSRLDFFLFAGLGTARGNRCSATDFHRLNTDLGPSASVKIREDPWLLRAVRPTERP